MRGRANYYSSSLNDGRHIFVFGSNLKGVHGAGAAKIAHSHWGAEMEVGRGITGQSYALPTKRTPYETLTLEEVVGSVAEFLDYAACHPEKTFLVTKVGCGLAAFEEYEIAPLFSMAPVNCVLPEGWRK